MEEVCRGKKQQKVRARFRSRHRFDSCGRGKEGELSRVSDCNTVHMKIRLGQWESLSQSPTGGAPYVALPCSVISWEQLVRSVALK